MSVKDWNSIKEVFTLCDLWHAYGGDFKWPQVDEAFIKHDSISFDEKKCLISLLLLFKQNVPFVNELNLNEKLISLKANIREPHLVKNEADCMIWSVTQNGCPSRNGKVFMFFNLSDEKKDISFDLKKLFCHKKDLLSVKDLWNDRDLFPVSSANFFCRELEPHSCEVILFK